MAEPSSLPLMNSSSLSIAPPPSSPPTSPRMNSPPLSIAPLPPSSSHSQPTPPTMNSPYLSIAPPLPSQLHSQPPSSPMISPSLSIALPPLSQSYSQPSSPLINVNPNHKYYQSAGSDELIFHNSKNFELSQVPMRIMFYLNNFWQDFKDEVLESLRYGFANGNAIFPLKIEGSMYIFDFLRMLQVHFNSMSHRSIAWIDENGKSFFPIKSIDHDFSKIVEDHVVAKQINLAQASKFPNAKLLNKSDKTYAYINNLFMNNIVNIDPHATITSIHEFQVSTPYGRACWDTFENQIEITEAARGKTNVVYGWYATPAEKVESIFYDGFKLLPNTLHPSIRAGIFLADLESPQHSGMQYQVDKDEEKHLILCRVVLGSMEKVYLECHQTNPSNEGYDTASDDPNNPNWYVVWADDINKRILPVCVVTCKTSAIEPPVKLKISPCELTYASRVYLEIKKRIPIALIPALEDIYGTFKKDRSISSFAMYKKRVHALIDDEKRKQIMMELYWLEH